MAHKHAHNHHHSHHHAHHHGHSGRIGLAFFLNAAFTIVELLGGWLTNSTAVMADAVHDLGDTLAIGLGWFLQTFSTKRADERYSYGYKRFSLLGAVINSAILIAGSILILIHAVPRLWAPEMPVVEGMFALAVLGVVVNGAAALGLRKNRSLNERVLSLHFVEDVLGWVAVLVVSIILWFYPLPILDPLLSIGFTLYILWRVVQTLREALGIFLQSVPDEAMLSAIKQDLLALSPVNNVHHLHLWSLDGTHHVLTAHLNLNEEVDTVSLVQLKSEVEARLSQYPLAHTTIEIELACETCRDETRA
jgi:cobalt-zinc-cadmium efflux system protein